MVDPAYNPGCSRQIPARGPELWSGIATPKGGDAVEQPLLPGFDRVVGLRGRTATAGGPLRAGFVSTYVPRQCGIATFTRDLIEGMHQAAKPSDGPAGRDVSASIGLATFPVDL